MKHENSDGWWNYWQKLSLDLWINHIKRRNVNIIHSVWGKNFICTDCKPNELIVRVIRYVVLFELCEIYSKYGFMVTFDISSGTRQQARSKSKSVDKCLSTRMICKDIIWGKNSEYNIQNQGQRIYVKNDRCLDGRHTTLWKFACVVK